LRYNNVIAKGTIQKFIMQDMALCTLQLHVVRRAAGNRQRPRVLLKAFFSSSDDQRSPAKWVAWATGCPVLVVW